MELIYLAGPPAAGKSTLMAELTKGCVKSERMKPFAHQYLIHPVTAYTLGAELGRQRKQFPGTDTLGMAVAPLARRWIAAEAAASNGFNLVLGEGDRLGISSFLQAATDARANVTLVHVDATVKTLNERCGERGSAQDETWRAGRATKARRLAEWAKQNNCRVIELISDGQSPAVLADALRSQVPILAILP